MIKETSEPKTNKLISFPVNTEPSQTPFVLRWPFLHPNNTNARTCIQTRQGVVELGIYKL